jgi:hypothetical protein
MSRIRKYRMIVSAPLSYKAGRIDVLMMVQMIPRFTMAHTLVFRLWDAGWKRRRYLPSRKLWRIC